MYLSSPKHHKGKKGYKVWMYVNDIPFRSVMLLWFFSLMHWRDFIRVWGKVTCLQALICNLKQKQSQHIILFRRKYSLSYIKNTFLFKPNNASHCPQSQFHFYKIRRRYLYWSYDHLTVFDLHGYNVNKGVVNSRRSCATNRCARVDNNEEHWDPFVGITFANRPPTHLR